MTRQEILDEVSQALGIIPGWLDAMQDPQLEEVWNFIKWEGGDTNLSVPEKLLVAFGTAKALQCPY